MALASLDRRTRRDSDLHTVTADELVDDVLPGLLDRHGALAARAIAALDAPPLAIELADRSFSLTLEAGDLRVVDGIAAGALVVSMDAPLLSDWAQLQQSFNGMNVARTLRFRDGTERDVSIWDSLWVCLLEGWPVVDDEVAFVDRDGDPLDLAQAFTPEDDPAEVNHFLREAGYLHLRGWIDRDLIATISEEVDRAVPEYTEGDGRSWWAELADGTHVCVRLQDFLGYSPATAAMLESDRWEQLRRTLQGDDQLVVGKSIEALVKPVGVVKGPSDVTFHRDCHLGRHPYGCTGTTIGVSVTPSSAENGRLRVAAGSHRVCMPVEIARNDAEAYLPLVAVSTEPGDLTVHLSCTLHEARPPVSEPRKVMYAGFSLPPLEDAPPESGRHLSDLRENVYKMLLEDEAPTAAGAWERSPA